MSSPSSPSSSSYSYNSSLLVIAVLLAFIFVFTIIIHLILRLLARLSSPSSNSTNSSPAVSSPFNLDPNRKSLIDSLPVFTLSSLPRSPSANCSICLSQFSASDKLRFLPACLHAFHSPCIDTWLKSSPSCPLCRSAVQCDHYVEPMPQHPQPPQQQQPPAAAAAAEESVRTSWLKEYMDGLVVSASSSFNSARFSVCDSFSSMRFSNWGSGRRLDGDGEGIGSMELGESFSSEEESGYFASSFKWIMAAAAANRQDSDS